MIRPSDVYRLEIAQKALGLLMALRSESIFHERKKAQPNAEIIEQWTAERNVLCALTRSMHCDNRIPSRMSSRPMALLPELCLIREGSRSC